MRCGSAASGQAQCTMHASGPGGEKSNKKKCMAAQRSKRECGGGGGHSQLRTRHTNVRLHAGSCTWRHGHRPVGAPATQPSTPGLGGVKRAVLGPAPAAASRFGRVVRPRAGLAADAGGSPAGVCRPRSAGPCRVGGGDRRLVVELERRHVVVRNGLEDVVDHLGGS